MTIRMHRSTDLGAPVMTGQQGKMNALLLEALCKGIPSAAPTSITQTGGLATCTMSAHGFLSGQTVTVYGATQSEYNGNKVITVLTPNTFTFAVSSGAVSPATGTISVGGQKTIDYVDEITRSGSTAMVAFPDEHGLSVGNRVFIQGADQPEYNGWQTVASVPDVYTITFELPTSQAPATPATGTILARYGEAGLGWSVAFSGANKTIFKQAADGAKVQAVLIADETNASHGTFGCGLSMAEGATSLSAYKNYPYTTEAPQACGVQKSGTADTVARKWIVIGDHRTALILTQPGAGTTYVPTGWTINYFGDFISYLPGDLYPILSGPSYRSTSYGFGTPTQVASNMGANSSGFATYYSYAAVNTSGDSHVPARTTRTHLGAIGVVNISLVCPGVQLSQGSAGAGGFAFGSRNDSHAYDIYPDPIHGGLNLDKLYVLHATTPPSTGSPVLRGELRGLWNPTHRRTQISTWANNDTFIGTGELAGKTFEMFDIWGSSATPSGWFVVETSDTWGA